MRLGAPTPRTCLAWARPDASTAALCCAPQPSTEGAPRPNTERATLKREQSPARQSPHESLAQSNVTRGGTPRELHGRARPARTVPHTA